MNEFPILYYTLLDKSIDAGIVGSNYFKTIKTEKMKSNDNRIEILKGLNKDMFFQQSDFLLRGSSQDKEITSDEHRKLFEVFQEKAENFFPGMQQGSAEAIRFRRICMLFHSKEESEANKQTLREQLQSQIDVGDIHDATGKIKPETLWGMICYQSPELKTLYTLDDEYDNKDTTLQASIVATSASLAIWSQKTAHLRR